MKKNGLTVLLAFALLAFGCGKETTVSTPGGDVKVTKKGDTTTFNMQSSKGEKVNVVASSGDKGMVLPANFPADIPVMPGAVVKLAVTSEGNLSVHFSVKAAQADAIKYYEENLKSNGWQIDATMNMGPSSMVSAKKGKRECVLTVVTEAAGGSIVQVMVPGEKG